MAAVIQRAKGFRFDELSSAQQAEARTFEMTEFTLELLDAYAVGREPHDLGEHATTVRAVYDECGPYHGRFAAAVRELASRTPNLRAMLDAIVTKRLEAVLYVPDGVNVCWLEEENGKTVFRYPRYEN